MVVAGQVREQQQSAEAKGRVEPGRCWVHAVRGGKAHVSYEPASVRRYWVKAENIERRFPVVRPG